ANDAENGHDVASVDADAAHPISERLDRETLARSLPRGRGAGRPPVVAADGQYGRFGDAGEVQPSMEVAAARSALAEEDEGRHVFPAHPRRPGDAHRVRNMGTGQGARAGHACRLPERRAVD